jgi:hypothetical protein
MLFGLPEGATDLARLAKAGVARNRLKDAARRQAMGPLAILDRDYAPPENVQAGTGKRRLSRTRKLPT